MSKPRLSLIVLALVVSGLLLYPILVGGSSAVPDKLLQEIVYVDRESGEVFLLRARSSPEFHPETGEQTLIPGMYCEKCKAWKAVGPLETLQSSKVPHKCRIHKIPLVKDGPIPEPQ